MTEQTTPPAAAAGDPGKRHVFRIEVPDLGVMISGAGTREAIARNLRWAADCVDGGAAGAVPDTGHPRLAEFRSLVEYAEQRDGVSVILPAAAARSLLDELAASASPSGGTGEPRS